MESIPALKEKLYYLYDVNESKDENGNVLERTRGVPAIAICIAKDRHGVFYRGISVASHSEKVVTKSDGRNRARGRMMRAFVRGSVGPDVIRSEASKRIQSVLSNGSFFDNPNKYDENALLSQWVANAKPTPFEVELFDER